MGGEILNSDGGHKILDDQGVLLNKNKDVHIGSNIWICSNVTILKGSQIKDGCILGSRSIVSSELGSPHSIYLNKKILASNIKWER